MKYELNVKFANGTIMKEQFCTLDAVKKTKQLILDGESGYKLTIKPLYLFY